MSNAALSTPPVPTVASFADLPAQRAAAPQSPAESRARYFNSGNAFNLKLSPVPGESFIDEPRRALDPATPTGLIACDRSKVLGCAFPATTPLVLAYYARIRAGESLKTNFAASGVFAYVIQGAGATLSGAERIGWKAGDLFVLPGGVAQVHQADATDAVLWIVTNEPLLAFENLCAPKPGDAPTELVHFPGDEIERQIALLYKVGRHKDIAGTALVFSSERQEAIRNALPSLTLAMNTLQPHEFQRPHRHNSVAVSLVVQGEGCYSMVDGRRKDWVQWATTITPATSVHSHHNEGGKMALFLIVQDGGLYYHARAMGFEFTEA